VGPLCVCGANETPFVRLSMLVWLSGDCDACSSVAALCCRLQLVFEELLLLRFLQLPSLQRCLADSLKELAVKCFFAQQLAVSKSEPIQTNKFFLIRKSCRIVCWRFCMFRYRFQFVSCFFFHCVNFYFVLKIW